MGRAGELLVCGAKLGGGRNPRSCYLNDPIGFRTADAPVIASLRRGAACAEAEKINKP
jgi:hypothetical protein